MLALLLCLSLTATSAPAAPLVLKELASGARLGAALWLDSSGWAEAIREALTGQTRPRGGRQEKQEDRDARVSRVELSPGGELTMRAGERLRFAAVAFDDEGAPVGGVKFKWQAEDVERGRRTRISPTGEFAPRGRGTYRVTAEAMGHSAQATVEVLDGERRRREGEQPDAVKEVSTRDLPPEVSAKKRRPRGAEQARRSGEAMFVKASYAPAAAAEPEPAAPEPAAAMLPVDGWNQDNYYYADDPGNEPGNPPGSPLDDGAGNGNFQLGAPVLSLPGRGIDLSLTLVYNSRLWSKTSSYEMTFDADRTWPAPGWSLGFGKMVGMGTSGSMLVGPDGTRHGFTGTVSNYGSSIYFTGKTADGSFIDYYSSTYNGAMYYGYAQLPNGTYVEYGAYGEGALYPTFIRDANGNYVTVTYVNNQGPRIQTVTDTLGRAVNFNYDGSGLLSSVTGPSLGGGTRTLVELQYAWRSVAYNFPGLTARVRATSFPFLQAVRYPGTGTGYWFGDADSYSPYGMIAKVSERHGMGTGGAIAAGAERAKTVYNYPMDTSVGHGDAPGYTTKTETWANMDTAAAVTTYAVFQSATPRRVEITQPDGTKNVQYSHNSPGSYLDGLVYNDQTLDAAGNLLQSSATNWEQGAYSSPRPSRVEVTDERGQTRKTEYSYGTSYNQVVEVRDYDYGGAALLRKTTTAYETGANYINNHIFSLPKTVEVYGPNGVTRVSRTEYQYDGQPLADTPGVVMHSTSHNPHAPQYWVEEYCYQDYCYDYPYNCQWHCDPGYWTSDYNPMTDSRGNVTQVKTYADAAGLGGAVVENRAYDINGNLVTASAACCEQTSFTYTAATQYAFTTSTTNGSATDATARVTSSAVYDFSTGLVLTETDASGRTSQNTYYAGTLRQHEEITPTGARTTYAYDDDLLKITETTTAAPAQGGAVADKSVTYLNGIGQARREESLAAAEAATWDGSVLDVVETTYDQMGRVWKQSRPYRKGAEQPQMTERVYDALGREAEIVGPDGSRTRVFFNEAARPGAASGAAGETVRAVDPWGRERWSRTDALGRLVEVVEPDPGGNGSVAANGSVTTYGYDTLGNLTLVTQGAQQRRFRYDSLGRKTHQKLAETAATLNDAGQYVGAGGAWSEVYGYDARSNLVSRTDARGVVTSFIFNDDPLNRLRSVTYTVGAAHDTSSPIWGAASVTYDYMTTGDVTRLRQTRVAGVSTEEYAYDSEARTSEHKLTLDSRPSHPSVTNYGYDSLGRVTSVTYPRQYPSTTRKTVTHGFDVTSRLGGLQVSGVSYASNITYNAASQTTSVDVGTGVGNWKQESYTYDPVTGLLTNQKVTRAGDANQRLLDLSYDYLRPGTTTGRTGQLTKLTNNLEPHKGRAFSYDALGRLAGAAGGNPAAAPLWTQTYAYDRYGNRTSVTASGSTASYKAPAEPATELPDVQLAARTEVKLPAEFRRDSRAAVSDSEPSLLGPARAAAEPGRGHNPSRLLPAARAVALPPTNLALGMPATQSSEGAGGVASRAVDGNTSGDWYASSVTHTNIEAQAWWQVDLGAVRSIETIKLWNRTDCCGDRLSGFHVLVSDQPFTSTGLNAAIAQPGVSDYYTAGQGGSPTTVAVNRTGRYVRVQLSGTNYLSLAEVEVLGSVVTSHSAVADFSASQNPAGPWAYGYKPSGGSFTPYGGTSTYFGAGTSTWALPGQACCPMVTKNGTGTTFTYPTAQSVVHPADVLNLHPGPSNERSVLRWTAPAAGAYSISGRFQGIDNAGTTADGLISHNGTTVFSASVNGFGTQVPFAVTRTVAAGDTVEFSVGFGNNGTYNQDSTGLAVTITPTSRVNVALASNGGVATASSSYTGSFPASAINNGDRKGLSWGGGGGWNDATLSAYPDWVQVDFSGSKTIDEVDVFTLQDSYASPSEPTADMTFTLYGATAFDVQYWNGSSWLTVPGGSVTGSNSVWKKFNFSPITTSKIRVLVNNSLDGYSRLIEVEAYGSSSSGASCLSSEQFIRDFYQAALARQPGAAELQNWQATLRNGYLNGAAAYQAAARQLGRALFLSSEYAGRGRTNRQYVEDLYWGYLGRAGDTAGINFWEGQVAAHGRENGVQAFEASIEFNDRVNGLCAPPSGGPVPADGLTSLTYDAASNRVTNAGWQYDAAGSQTRIQTSPSAWQRMEYDAAGRLVAVKTDGGVTLATYTYGDSNARLVAHEGATRTYYAWGPGGVIAEYTEAGGSASPQWGRNYIYMEGRLLATQQPGGAGEIVQYHHPDRLGTRLVSNAADAGFFEQATLPFGVGLAAEATGSTTRNFTSYDRSNTTGLDYAINRFYDPQQGRFTTVDPLELGAVDLSDPQTLNLYAYCVNDPVNGVDPDGLLFGWIGKLFKGIWKVLTSKWFIIAATVALTVISIGSAAGLWSLFKPIYGTLTLGGHALGTTPLVLTGVQTGITFSAIGWVSAGLTAALAIPGLTSVSGILTRAASFGLGQVLGGFGGGSVGAGGTPDWNENANGLIQRGGGRRPPPRRGPLYRGPGSWHYGTGRSPRRQKRPSRPEFPNLGPHARKHPIPGVSRGAYYESAVWHTRNHHKRFKFRHEGQDKFGYVTRLGEDTFLFTSTTLNGRVIFTHMVTHGQYLRNQGINVTSYPVGTYGPFPTP